MTHVTSRDGTPIACERAGSGPAAILAGDGLDDGSENPPLVPELAGRFTVLNYARRGRGESGDAPPYSAHREIEDLDALITAALPDATRRIVAGQSYVADPKVFAGFFA
ncbi:hypothetical protein LCL61_34100 [Amycolatopsis coloradensis]|uniref:Uncharacterized protein n=1 Tax=Amycolatopsis coloradensis TaxID=76021 RepID=A0ACD5BMK9_9PSEU